jgi:hypothetical protein
MIVAPCCNRKSCLSAQHRPFTELPKLLTTRARALAVNGYQAKVKISEHGKDSPQVLFV